MKHKKFKYFLELTFIRNLKNQNLTISDTYSCFQLSFSYFSKPLASTASANANFLILKIFEGNLMIMYFSITLYFDLKYILISSEIQTVRFNFLLR